jgi:recombinational DNA repair protein RecR
MKCGEHDMSTLRASHYLCGACGTLTANGSKCQTCLDKEYDLDEDNTPYGCEEL